IETALALSLQQAGPLTSAYQAFHPLGRAGLVAAAPQFAWDAYLTAMGAGTAQDLNMTSPDFVHQIGVILATYSEPALKPDLQWQLIRTALPALGADYSATTLSGSTLTGAVADPARAATCMSTASRDMVDAMARPFVAKTFSDADRARAEATIHAIATAL